MIQISKDMCVNWTQVLFWKEDLTAGSGSLTLTNNSRLPITPEYWPTVKSQLLAPTDREFEVLGALRYLDEFALTFNISTSIQTLDIPEGKTVTEVLIALAKALHENNVTPQAE